MNIIVTDRGMMIKPESEEERLLLHNLKFKGICSMQLKDIGKSNEHLLITLCDIQKT